MDEDERFVIKAKRGNADLICLSRRFVPITASMRQLMEASTVERGPGCD